jgi:hypothetical protein
MDSLGIRLRAGSIAKKCKNFFRNRFHIHAANSPYPISCTKPFSEVSPIISSCFFDESDLAHNRRVLIGDP